MACRSSSHSSTMAAGADESLPRRAGARAGRRGHRSSGVFTERYRGNPAQCGRYKFDSWSPPGRMFVPPAAVRRVAAEALFSTGLTLAALEVVVV